MSAAHAFEQLVDAVERLGPSEHLCMSYQTREEALAAVIPFLRRGLDRREQCIVIASEGSRSAILAAMQSEGIAVGTSMESGALSVIDARDTYRRNGSFDPEQMLAWVRERARAATGAGFSALRIVGDMVCIAEGKLDVEQLAEYEAKLNYLLPNQPVSALCLYDRGRFRPDIIREVIVTHPLVVVGGTVCRNPYFVPPDDYLAPNWPEREVEWLLKTLSAIQRTQDDLGSSEARYRMLSRRLIDVQETERRGIARDLHDHLGQILTAIKINLQPASRARRPRVKGGMPRGRRRADRLADSLGLVDEAIEGVRNIASDLRPPMLDDFGLAATLQWYVSRQAQRGGFEVELELAAIEAVRFPSAVELACFRLVQEAITNVVRHAEARRVEVKVRIQDGSLDVVVRDDGLGFDVEAARKRAVAGGSLGLLSMEERISLAGGRFAIESARGEGTTVRARLSLNR